MILVRRLFAVFVVLTMIATTGTMAGMRDRDAGTHAMVICNGSGLQVILLDANGERVDPAPICPECTMVVLAEGPPPPFMVLRGDAKKITLARVQASQLHVRLDKTALKARAPPVG